MKIIRKYKKTFIGLGIIAFIIASTPILFYYWLFNKSSLEIDLSDLEKTNNNIEEYFEGDQFTKDIVESFRKKSTEDLNAYSVKTFEQDDRYIFETFGNYAMNIMELNRLEEGKRYNLRLYSEYYEKDAKIKTDEILSKDIDGKTHMYILYSDSFMSGGSKRDVDLYITDSEKVIETANYYLPANWNEACIVQDIDFNLGENIPMYVFNRGIKVDGKYKTDAPNLSKSREKAEESIKKSSAKNDQTVVIRLEINEI